MNWIKELCPISIPYFFLHWGSLKPGSLNFPPHFDTFHLKLIQTCNYSHAKFLFFSIISNHINCCFGISASFFLAGRTLLICVEQNQRRQSEFWWSATQTAGRRIHCSAFLIISRICNIGHGRWEVQCNRGWTFKVAVQNVQILLIGRVRIPKQMNYSKRGWGGGHKFLHKSWLDQISSSDSRPNINFNILNKHQHLD